MGPILITGGAGFIGSHLVDHFVEAYPDSPIRVFDKLTYAADVRNISAHLESGRVELMVGDVSEHEACEQACQGIEVVVHAAAESHVDNSFVNSSHFTRSNALGTHVLIEAARHVEVKKFIHISTDEVYGENRLGGDVAHNEGSVLSPTNPYAASKAAAEMIVQSYVHAFAFPATIIRANNIFGVRQFPEKLIPRTILRLLRGNKAIIQGNGLHRRSFLSALDLADAVDIIMCQSHNGAIYNVGSSSEFRNIDVVKTICERLQLDPEKHIEYVSNRPFNDSRYLIDYSKMKSLGWEQKRFIEDEWDQVIDWYAQHLDRYRQLDV